jgi:aminomethyltransferase
VAVPTTSSLPSPLLSPLHDRHVAEGARFADFAGWSMPLEYPGTGGGVVAEHTAVRTAVGVFDVSHLGKLDVRGTGAAAFVNSALTNDLDRIGPGQAQYTLCCDPTGGVVDDLIAYRYADDHIFLVPNAANAAGVVRLLVAAAPAGISIVDRHRAVAVIAVQGPASAELLDRVGLPAGQRYMAFAGGALDGRPVPVCRTGYTGEHGYELLPAVVDAPAVWDALLAAGADLGVRPCGLGARDTLRTEMGYPLHGQDLSPSISPVQAVLGWAVGWDKPAFWGREALIDERSAGPARRLWGIEAVDRAIPRQHMAVRAVAGGAPVGEVTSGTFSPTRKLGIGLALLDRDVAEGDEVWLDVRGRAARVRVVKPPFVPSRVR